MAGCAEIGTAYQSLGLLDVLLVEQKLAVQVGEVDGVEVDDMDLAKAGEDEVLEQFASNATGADHEDSCLSSKIVSFSAAFRVFPHGR